MGEPQVTVKIIPYIPPPPPVMPEPTVTITMPKGYAQALMDVFWRVGGNPKDTDRGKIEAIYNALVDAGFRSNDSNTEGVVTFLWKKGG